MLLCLLLAPKSSKIAERGGSSGMGGGCHSLYVGSIKTSYVLQYRGLLSSINVFSFIINIQGTQILRICDNMPFK